MIDLPQLAFEIADEHADETLAAVLRVHASELSWSQARKLCSSGKVRLDGQVSADPALRVRAGQRVEVDPNARKRRAGELPDDAILYADREVVVVMKPSGLLSVPYAGEKDTLIDLTRAALRRRDGRALRYDPSLGIVHRLDKDTSGLLVFTRSVAAKKHLATQFRERTVLRHYLALAHGDVAETTFDTHLVTNRGDGLRGSWGVLRRATGGPPPGSRRAITYAEPLETLSGATLVRCRLRTGRQHQIRIHLSEAGHMLLGERVYVRDYRGTPIAAPRTMLHARELGFVHPRTDTLIEFDAPPPADFERALSELRGATRGAAR